jgi:hypothetical protein
MSNSLSRYAQSPGDRLNPDHDETVLGHLLLEQGRGLQWSIENLAPSAREFRRDTEAAVSATKFTAITAAVAGVIAGTASLPVGMPFAAVAGVSYLAWRSTKAALPRREAEYQLLKLCPKLPDFLWALHLKGISPEEVLTAYDDLVERFEAADDVPEDQAIAKTLWDKVQAMRGATEFTQTALGSLTEPSTALPPAPPAPQGGSIVASLAENLTSTLIVGLPGAGKDLAASHAIAALKQSRPEVWVVVIDPKGCASEAEYYSAADEVLRCPLSPFATPAQVGDVQIQVDSAIRRFAERQGPKLLVLGEASALKEKTGKWFKGLVAGFNALCSMGRSSEAYGWLIAQSPNVEDWGISGGSLAVYRRVAIVAQDNPALLHTKTRFMDATQPDGGLLQQTGRIWWDSLTNTWTPLESLQAPQTASQTSRREALEAAYAFPSPSPQPPIPWDLIRNYSAQMLGRLQELGDRDSLLELQRLTKIGDAKAQVQVLISATGADNPDPGFQALKNWALQ